MPPLSSIPSHSTPSPSPKETFQVSANTKNTNKSSVPLQQSESVSISQAGQEINHHIKVMTNLPDVRQERITQIRLALEKGSYSVSSKALADKLIQEISNQPSDSSSSRP